MVVVLTYLGSHWSSAREAGEPQLTFNWIKAFTDFVCNFCFARGVTFKSPMQTSAIVPSLLNRVWTVDNDRGKVLWEIAQMGSITGDAFVKIAFQEPMLWPPMEELIPGVKQSFLPGKVRILPLNSSYCFPIWAPHDRDKLIQFTQKYRYFAPAADGTRQVKVYVEVLTDTEIREYVDDVLITEPRPNPLGFIPVVHIPNTMVSGSPWGLADCQDIIGLNRSYNEVATQILDIVSYYSTPVTIISGANQQSLMRGGNNMWSVPKGAEVSNLEGGQAGIPAALNMMMQLKSSMHELVGVPEGALGQQQPVSNTAGVAITLNYLCMMQRYDMKKILYGKGLRDINELILRTLAVKEPETAIWDASTDEELKPGQLSVLDWDDPITYRTEVHWPSPLPVDVMRVLQEEQTKMGLGLQSRKGALAELGEEFPNKKNLEIFGELLQDAIDQGALDMVKAQINSVIMEETGMAPPDGSEQAIASAGGPNVNSASDAGGASGTGEGSGQPGRPAFVDTPVGQTLLADLQARALGTKISGATLPTETNR